MKLEQHLSLDLQMRAFKVGQNEDICRIPRKSFKVNLFIVSSKADKVRKKSIKVETIPKFQNIYIKTTNSNQMTKICAQKWGFVKCQICTDVQIF